MRAAVDQGSEFVCTGSSGHPRNLWLAQKCQTICGSGETPENLLIASVAKSPFGDFGNSLLDEDHRFNRNRPESSHCFWHALQGSNLSAPGLEAGGSPLSLRAYKWARRELNPRPCNFQSHALPIELLTRDENSGDSIVTPSLGKGKSENDILRRMGHDLPPQQQL
jgi:hypothetical protein